MACVTNMRKVKSKDGGSWEFLSDHWWGQAGIYHHLTLLFPTLFIFNPHLFSPQSAWNVGLAFSQSRDERNVTHIFFPKKNHWRWKKYSDQQGMMGSIHLSPSPSECKTLTNMTKTDKYVKNWQIWQNAFQTFLQGTERLGIKFSRNKGTSSSIYFFKKYLLVYFLLQRYFLFLSILSLQSSEPYLAPTGALKHTCKRISWNPSELTM